MRDFMIETAHDAGTLALEYFGSLRSDQVSLKGTPRDLVSVADKAVEELIVSRIRARFPEHGIWGEETGIDKAASDYCWVIDPIDGTQNFVKNIPAFSVSIGLEYKGRSIAGCVYQPALGTTFSAEEGKGAFENGRRIHVSDCAELSEAVCATGFACLRAGWEHNNLVYFNQIAPILRSVLRTGSAAYDLCLVASGRLDGFWELALAEYDVAAGVIIAREAGAVVTDLSGGSEFPGKGIICAPQPIHTQLRRFF